MLRSDDVLSVSNLLVIVLACLDQLPTLCFGFARALVNKIELVREEPQFSIEM